MTTPNEELIKVLTQTNQFHDNADICTEDVIAAMQSQAERIKELEAEIITRTGYGDEQTDFAIKLAAERDALRAQLAETEMAEPVAYITDTEQGPMVWTPEMYGEACTYCDDGEFPVPLYTQPAQMRILTDEQIKSMWAQYCSYPGGILDFARAIRDVK